METIEIRCSSLPLAFTCPGSIRPADVQVNPVNEPADVGTAVHFGLAKLVRGTDADEALALAQAEYPHVDENDVRRLFYVGVRAWKVIREWSPMHDAEVYMEHGVLSGHADVWMFGGDSLVVVDWKSGYKDRSYREQLFGYAWLALKKNEAAAQVTVHAVWLQTGEIESYTVTRERSEEWHAKLQGEVINWDGEYHPGDHCLHCPRNHACPAQTAMVRRDVAMFEAAPSVDLQSMANSDFVILHRKAKSIASYLEKFLEETRAEISRRGGDVPAGDGTHLVLREVNGSRVVDAMKAWPILQVELTDEELAAAVKISMTKVDEAVAAKAPRGQKGKAKQALAVKLEDAGALHQATQVKLFDERIK